MPAWRGAARCVGGPKAAFTDDDHPQGSVIRGGD